MKICLLTHDLAGPIRNGGIGTAFTALAEELAEAGHEVTILYPSGFTETQPLSAWIEDYAARGIRLESLHHEGDEARQSLAAAHWLMARDFDVVHYHEWRGIGFFAAAARRAGLGLHRTALVCQLHSPTAWHRRNSHDFAATPEAAAISFMERRSAELADLVFSPSRYLVEWVAKEGWRLPARTRVHPNLLPAQFATGRPRHRTVREPVFFGRLEERKGLDLFCAAITRLVREGRAPERVAFLGKVGEAGGEDALSFIARAARSWPFPWEVRNELDVAGARAFLTEPGRIAVIASVTENSPYTVLECLAAGTPFLAPEVGGIPELVLEEDRPLALYRRDEEGLATRLAALLESGAAPVRPALSFAETREAWRAMQHEAAALAPLPAPPADAPLVSVVLCTYNRPVLLAEALASLEAQTWPNLEVVVVDDCSPDPAAQRFLRAIEPRLAARGWRLVRHEANRYLGAARNTGVAHATGRYVLFMDDDNIAYPWMVEHYVRAAQASGAGILTCQIHVFSGEGRGPAHHPAEPNDWIPLGGPAELGFLQNCFGDAGFLVRRDLFDSLGGFTTERAAFEDWEFLLRAALRGEEILCLPEALYHYRAAAGGMLRGMTRHQAWRSHARIARAWRQAELPALREALSVAMEIMVAPRYPAPPGDLVAANGAAPFAALARRLAAEGHPAAAPLMEQACRLAPSDVVLRLERLAMPGAGEAGVMALAGLVGPRDRMRAAPVLAALREAGKDEAAALLEAYLRDAA
ncbi:glycosyltransferase [Sabulicella rubraurantiaca]|uniref:glycosyltransferase n=1 Tax=Sabulicella rubraurantiaca TaxID=2811429 RepID=UPI001A96F741|nr:glycosyltransferase [Sabulicella rubraurantiaca]